MEEGRRYISRKNGKCTRESGRRAEMEEGRRYISRKNGKCTRESGRRAEAAGGPSAHLPGRSRADTFAA